MLRNMFKKRVFDTLFEHFASLKTLCISLLRLFNI